MSDLDIRAMYAEVEERIDMDYVRQTARFVAASLRGQGEAIGVAFQPGDATRYDLLFVPIQALRFAPGRVVDGKSWGMETSFGISVTSGTAIVFYEQQGRACGFDFRSPGFEPVYLVEILGTGLPSACTFALLFNAIGEAWNG